MKTKEPAGQCSSAIKAAALAAVLPVLAIGQTIVSPTNSNTFGANATGVAASSGNVTASSGGTNFNFEPTDLSHGSPVSYGNSGGVVDIGVTADGAKTIELYSSGAFSIFQNSNRLSIGGGNIGPIASAWGISSSYVDGQTGKENVWIGYTDLSSNKSIGRYNLTDAVFVPVFTFVLAQTPTGLGNYFLAGGSETAHQRLLVAFSNNTFYDFTAGGTAMGNYIWDTASFGTLQDLSYHDGVLYGVTGNMVESAPFGIQAIPEPSTVAMLGGVFAALVVAVGRRYRGKRGKGGGGAPAGGVQPQQASEPAVGGS